MTDSSARIAPARIAAPTRVDAGHGTLDGVLAEVDPGAVAVLCDPAVAAIVARIAAQSPRHALLKRSVERPPTLKDVGETARWIEANAVVAVLAVGGGRVLDLAKLATTVGMAAEPLERLERMSRRAGYAQLDPGVGRALPLLVVPTTLGTGAESSAVAVVDGADGDRTLVHSPRLAPTAAVLDPAATATLATRLIREGALEALLRVCGAEIGCASGLELAGREALWQADELAQTLDALAEVDGPADDALRLRVAQLSSATHRGWALAGRSPYPSPLWFLGTELSVVLKTTKMAATARLLATWLGRVADGDDRWGDLKRMERVWAALRAPGPAAAAAVAMPRMLEAWGLAPEPVQTPVDAVGRTTERVVRRWGGRLPMLRRFSSADVESILADALSATATPSEIAL